MDLIASTKGMSAKEFVAYMADLSSEAKKALLHLSLLIEASYKCVDYAERLALLINENGQIAKHNTSLVFMLDQEKETNLRNKVRESGLKTKLKGTQKDLKDMNYVLKEKLIT